MPQWGVQGLVNGWVKVNNKHAVFVDGRPQNDDDKGRDGQRSQETSRNDEPPRLASRKKVDRRKGGDHGGDTASTASSWDDPEIRAIRRYNSRKNRRRLQRTISHSDLVREMAMSKEKDAEGNTVHRQGEAETKSVPSHVSKTSEAETSIRSALLGIDDSNRQQEADIRSHVTAGEKSTGSTNSLRWVTGLFDAPSETKKQMHHIPSQPKPPPNPITTGKYLNETAFVQQYQQSKHNEAQSNHQLAASSVSATTDQLGILRSSAGEAQQDPISTLSKDGSVASAESEKLELRGLSLSGAPPSRATTPGGDDVHLAKQGSAPWSSRSMRNHAATGSTSCSYCEEITARLYAAQADLEYLRNVSLREENLCSAFGNQSASRKKKYGRVSSSGGSSALSEASQRLVEVSGRHKRQIEQMTRERSRWQQDIHFKLSKSAMMCNHWSKEAAIRSEEETSLESELLTTQTERNALTSEVQTLRAQLVTHKKEATEHQALQATVAHYEEHGLDAAEDAIRKRDAIISDLSLKLERTLETLGMEREQQRQRRQIIFPVARASQNPGSGRENRTVTSELVKLNEELDKAKDDARSAEEMLVVVKAEAAQKEKELQLRCEQLEKLLNESRLQEESANNSSGQSRSAPSP